MLRMEYSIIDRENFQEVRNEVKEAIKRNPKTKIVFVSKNTTDELAQKILEKESIDVLMIILSKRRDKTKQRNSGFNQVMGRLAKKRGVVIGINLDEIINSKGKEKSEILSRLKQNIKICSKNKLKMKFISLKKENHRDIYDLKALGLVLGMPTWMTSQL